MCTASLSSRKTKRYNKVVFSSPIATVTGNWRPMIERVLMIFSSSARIQFRLAHVTLVRLRDTLGPTLWYIAGGLLRSPDTISTCMVCYDIKQPIPASKVLYSITFYPRVRSPSILSYLSSSELLGSNGSST